MTHIPWKFETAFKRLKQSPPLKPFAYVLRIIKLNDISIYSF